MDRKHSQSRIRGWCLEVGARKLGLGVPTLLPQHSYSRTAALTRIHSHSCTSTLATTWLQKWSLGFGTCGLELGIWGTRGRRSRALLQRIHGHLLDLAGRNLPFGPAFRQPLGQRAFRFDIRVDLLLVAMRSDPCLDAFATMITRT